MIQNIVILLLVAAIALPVGLLYLYTRRVKNIRGALKFNLATFFAVMVASTVILAGSAVAQDVQPVAAAAADGSIGYGLKYIAAALAVGCSTIGAGLATGKAASSALGALSENEGIMGKALIFVALAEGVAIYGLLIAFIIINS